MRAILRDLATVLERLVHLGVDELEERDPGTRQLLTNVLANGAGRLRIVVDLHPFALEVLVARRDGREPSLTLFRVDPGEETADSTIAPAIGHGMSDRLH